MFLCCNFQQTSSGELQMLGNSYSTEFADKIEHYLTNAKSIPALSSAASLSNCSTGRPLLTSHHIHSAIVTVVAQS